MSDIYQKSLIAHKAWKGKLRIELNAPITNKEELSLAYTPGVAEPCREIHRNPESVYDYTWKGNTVAVITDGTAVLGLGDIGPHASLPVMEGKCALFKSFADIDAVPIALDTKDPDEIIRICKALAPSFGGINLEDISAPRCVQIERELKRSLSIPVFHDDQHGTAIVVAAGLINALKLVKKEFKDLKVVVSGAGAAGSSIMYMLRDLGVINILGFRKEGIILKEEHTDFLVQELSEFTNPSQLNVSLQEAMVNADVFIGVSAPKLVSKSMIQSMNKHSIVFALANPEPEISYEDAKEAGAYIIATGRSDYPNQVNNVLAFPGLFRGALDAKATQISEEMKKAAAYGLSSLIQTEELNPDYIIPSVFDKRVKDVVSQAVKDVAIASGCVRIS
ncbi:MAG TPA: malic enzyme-like NAD(P)-binding protein [Erysipelotrichaceae bacterium]|nr:malic enzyme-like NAD(P)-binding protein [Erysipelotrichaceae bacterium]